MQILRKFTDHFIRASLRKETTHGVADEVVHSENDGYVRPEDSHLLFLLLQYSSPCGSNDAFKKERRSASSAMTPAEGEGEARGRLE